MEIKKVVEKNFDKAVDFLVELIKFKSISGEGEKDVQEFIKENFSQFGKAELVEIDENIKRDPEYTFSDKDLDYSERKNLVLKIEGTGEGKSLILNSHCDVVPAADWKDAFNPVIKDGYLYGRGACDAKGQVATIYLTLLTLKELGIKLKGDIIVEIVIEEEIGGNGTLSLIRDGYKGDGVVVFEPTDMKIHPANRGALWFKLEIEGKSVHMGKKIEGVGAIEKMCFIVRKLIGYEEKLIEESRNVPLFEKFDPPPVQVNFGTIEGKGWPSMVCSKVELEGGVGFLPNKNITQIKEEVESIIRESGDEWIKNHYKLSFNKLHNDAYSIPPEHPLVNVLKEASENVLGKAVVEGWVASCDARLFNKIGKMPVVVFGPGCLDDAHSNNEKIKVEDIKKAGEVATETVIKWCGGKKW